ncbi:MAG: universal stress protein [Planctomycetes bacterium]|nr:universal stress protein [Planctomycetota bacterium]
MYRTILVPVDGSPMSEYAIPFAIEIARRTGGKVRLLRVLDRVPMDMDFGVCGQPEFEEAGKAQADALKAAYETPDVAVESGVCIGAACEEILRGADGADLVILGTDGRGGVERWIPGSTADKVIRLTSKSVLVIRPPEPPTRALAEAEAERMLSNFAVALDGSPLAERALDELRQFAAGDAHLHFIHVVPRRTSGADVDAAETYLRRVGAGFAARGVHVAASVELSDDTAGAITAFAVRHKCGMIAMGTHGASGLKRWVLGSVAEQVVRRGQVPVLVIRRGRRDRKAERQIPAAAALHESGRDQLSARAFPL